MKPDSHLSSPRTGQLLDREAEYRRLNAELQQRTAQLMRQTEQVR
jgi:hypothetical protein